MSEKKALNVNHPPEGEDILGEYDDAAEEEIRQMLEEAHSTPMKHKAVRY